MNFGGLFQTGNPNAGGWRYDYSNRPTSNSALQSVNAIDPEFLKKVAALQGPEKKGLLDAAVTATPLTGLLESGGQQGVDNTPNAASASGMGATTPGGNPAVNSSPAGLSLGYDPKGGALGFAKGGLLGALSGITATQLAPVQDIALPGLNGFGFADTNYGSSDKAMGAPNPEQAQALADALAAALGGYAAGGQSGGYGGYGGDTSSGAGGFGFGGVY